MSREILKYVQYFKDMARFKQSVNPEVWKNAITLSKDWIPKKQTTFAYGQFTTISGRFLPATQISFTKFRFWWSFRGGKHVEIPIKSKSLT